MALRLIRFYGTHIAITIAITATLLGCGGREVPPRFYVATSTLERKAETVSPGAIRKASPSAGNLLKSGEATVAFLPPEWCDTRVDEENTHSKEEIKACLSITAAVEQRASQQGYRVVDWRLLRPNPHESAQKAGVDALFVFDEVYIHKTSMDRYQITDIKFSKQESTTENIPIEVNNLTTVKARCRGAHKARQRRNLDQASITGANLSLKMVSVQDGTAQWFYSHNVSDDNAATKQVVDYYYLSEGTKEIQTRRLVLGLLFSAAGAVGLSVGVKINEEGDSFAKRNMGFGLAWVSVLPLTVGLVMTTAGLISVIKRPAYQPPDKVICARPPYKENPLADHPSNSATDSSTPERTPRSKKERHGPPSGAGKEMLTIHSPLIDDLADHFMDAVRTLSLDRVATPPPPTVAPSPAPLPESHQVPTTDENKSGVIIRDTYHSDAIRENTDGGRNE